MHRPDDHRSAGPYGHACRLQRPRDAHGFGDPNTNSLIAGVTVAELERRPGVCSMKSIRIVLAAIALALLPLAAHAEVIKLGLSCPMSGAAASWGLVAE